MAFYKFKPALRLVNSSGGVIAGPLKLWMPDSLSQGILLGSSVPRYAPEVISYQNLSYADRWRLLGYRPEVDLVFPAVLADGASGYALLHSYYFAGLQSGTFAALQFNLYHDTSSVWRGMYPTSAWEPKPIGGKQRSGYEITISLRARDLIAAPGDFTNGGW